MKAFKKANVLNGGTKAADEQSAKLTDEELERVAGGSPYGMGEHDEEEPEPDRKYTQLQVQGAGTYELFYAVMDEEDPKR